MWFDMNTEYAIYIKYNFKLPNKSLPNGGICEKN